MVNGTSTARVVQLYSNDGVVMKPTNRYYSEFASDQISRLSDASDEFQRLMEFWKNELEPAPMQLQLPTDRPRTPVRTFKGSAHIFTVDKGVAELAKQFAIHSGTTMYTILMSTFQMLLAKYTAQTQIAVGTPMACRTSVADEDVVGYYVNPVVFIGDLAGNPSFQDVVDRTKNKLMRLLDHQDAPLFSPSRKFP